MKCEKSCWFMAMSCGAEGCREVLMGAEECETRARMELWVECCVGQP
jgi:hypothetical protein